MKSLDEAIRQVCIHARVVRQHEENFAVYMVGVTTALSTVYGISGKIIADQMHKQIKLEPSQEDRDAVTKMAVQSISDFLLKKDTEH